MLMDQTLKPKGTDFSEEMKKQDSTTLWPREMSLDIKAQIRLN